MSAIRIAENQETSNFLGCFVHNELIGKPFGSKWTGKNGKVVMALHPTPMLWSMVLFHRTQIIHIPDAAFILSVLEIVSGSVVVESGTGSGSLSCHFSNAIAPKGHLHTFEYHRQRAEMAETEFKNLGLDNHITIHFGDVCEGGFGKIRDADCVFLDLPNPWLAIPHAPQVFRSDKYCKIGCFSPCIEQVQKTCRALSEHGFQDLQMIQIQVRPYNLQKIVVDGQDHKVLCPPEMISGHTGYLTFGVYKSKQEIASLE